MRWLMIGAVCLLAACAAKTAPLKSHTEMLPKASAEKVLTENGYSNPTLMPSQRYLGGWRGTAVKGGSTVSLVVDKDGKIILG